LRKNPVRDRMSEPVAKKSRVVSGGEAAVKSVRVAYAGLPGCFSERAANQYFGSKLQSEPYSTRGLHSAAAVFQAVHDGVAEFGVVPVENSYSGSLHQMFDHLLGFEQLKIVGEIGCLEEHCLLSPSAITDKKALRAVRGHPHILDACSRYLDALEKANGGELRREPAMNSASACKDLSQAPTPEPSAAIAPFEAAGIYNMNVLERGIANDKNAETRYVILGRSLRAETDPTGWLGPAKSSTKIPMFKSSVVLALSNVKGSVFKVIAQFATRNIDILKVETRPAATANSQLPVLSSSPRHWDYLFYIDYEPSKNAETNKQLVNALAEFSMWMRELGTYQAHSNDLVVSRPDWSVLDAASC